MKRRPPGAAVKVHAVSLLTSIRVRSMSTHDLGKEVLEVVANPDGEFAQSREYVVGYVPPMSHQARSWLPPDVRKAVLGPGRCAACGSTSRLEVDHVIPISRGGGDGLDNLQPLCKSCNCSKKNRLPSEWDGGV